MYTGIVLGTETILSVQAHKGHHSIVVSNTQGFFNDVFLGASVAIDGTCLTICAIAPDQKSVGFDIAAQTLSLTTLSQLKVNDQVNVERSFKMGMENGGHNLYGHIEGSCQVIELSRLGETLHLKLKIPTEKMKYFFLKGFIGLHGCSLTVNQVNKQESYIAVDLIPETLRLTNFKSVQLGDQLNFEIDQTTRTLVDTIEGIYQNRL
ncbi:riboflavin synthase subunit alpha [Acinetobacter rudis]|uniref:riboflavin synthase subunit alpha n=1 Tax=Acinetobacter rudis TaxID=632955 RepID=UPI00280FB907|nr:riboflavin synthase subunit alpha [Acinetobacter rudis]MDQ8953772.1 riboflavin synthase subunit alpha [Acinetobacter rudis]